MASDISGKIKPNRLAVQRSGGKERIGNTLSIGLSEPAGSVARWTLHVYAELRNGQLELGRVRPSPPGGGVPNNRIVAFAHCPGATGWRVDAIAEPLAGAGAGTELAAKASIELVDSECCETIRGVVAVNPFGESGADDWIAGVETAVVAFNPGPVLLSVADPNRLSIAVRNLTAGTPIAIGTSPALAFAAGMQLQSTDPPFRTTYRGAIYVVSSGGPAAASVWREIR